MAPFPGYLIGECHVTSSRPRVVRDVSRSMCRCVLFTCTRCASYLSLSTRSALKFKSVGVLVRTDVNIVRSGYLQCRFIYKMFDSRDCFVLAIVIKQYKCHLNMQGHHNNLVFICDGIAPCFL